MASSVQGRPVRKSTTSWDANKVGFGRFARERDEQRELVPVPNSAQHVSKLTNPERIPFAE